MTKNNTTKKKKNNFAGKSNRYIVLGTKPWTDRLFKEQILFYEGDWFYMEKKEDLSIEKINIIKPRYIFFLHWSWIVPDEIIDKYECVCFHMTDVPFGRGGSPLQNLIMNGHRQTKLTALRMVHELDAGPVYMKRDLCLEGNAEEIYLRATYLSAEMIKDITTTKPVPMPQAGEAVVFKRRTPAQSAIPSFDSLIQLHDFIRMLDADGYPRAFIEYNGFRYEFSRANIYDGHIIADVKITPIIGVQS